MIRRWRARCLNAALLATALACAAVASADPAAGTPALRVEDQAIPRGLAEDLLVLARREQPSLGLPDLLQRLALEWLLGEEARRRVGDEHLFATRRVAFEPEALVERQWQSLAWQRWPEALTRDWDRWQRRARVAPAGAEADAAWRQFLQQAGGPGLIAPSDRRRHALAGAAARVELLRWCESADCRVPSRVTLAQVWPSLNVQGRTQIAAGDRDFAQAQARRWLQDRFTREWAARPDHWGTEGAVALQALLWSRVRWQAMLRWEGLDGDAHGAAAGSPALAPTAAVTDADIERYWQEHPDEFRRISRLEGWRARCADRACRDAVEALLRQVGDLDALSRHGIDGLSVRPVHWTDDGAGPGRPFLRAGRPSEHDLDDWSLSLMAATPVGARSAALRHPGVDSQGWEWVQVQRREERPQALDSETVRYGATQALTQQRRLAAWRERQEQLLAGARLQWAPDLAAPVVSPLLEIDAAHGGHAHD